MICKRNHQLTPDNIYTDPKGKKHCIICRRTSWEKYKKKREGVPGKCRNCGNIFTGPRCLVCSHAYERMHHLSELTPRQLKEKIQYHKDRIEEIETLLAGGTYKDFVKKVRVRESIKR